MSLDQLLGQLVPSIVHGSDALSTVPEHRLKIHEARQNDGLNIDERAELLLEGLSQAEENRGGSEDFWAMGQGALAGTVAGATTNRAFSLLGKVPKEITEHQNRSKKELLATLVRAAEQTTPGISNLIQDDVANLTGMNLRPRMSVGHLIDGPLTSRAGGVHSAIQDYGDIVEKRLGEVGVTRGNSQVAAKALRAAEDKTSLWDNIVLGKLKKGINRTLRVVGRPSTRLGILSSMIGSGALYGYVTAEDDPLTGEDDIDTMESAREYLRSMDKRRALSRADASQTTQGISDFQGQANRLPSALQRFTNMNFGVLERSVGNTVRTQDAKGSATDPHYGLRWVG